MKKFFTLVFTLVCILQFTAQTVLKSDPNHSRMQFVVKHLSINEITGNFDRMEMRIKKDDKNFVNSNISFSADATSINTNVEARDKHLKGEDFFAVDKFGKIEFTSTSIAPAKVKDHYFLKGNLTMHGVTKPVTLSLVFRGSTVNAMSKKNTYGYQVTGTLKRTHFGIGTKFPDAMVSDAVEIKGDFELLEENNK